MKNPQEDDAVERMLNQLEGLLKRQHDSARASRSALAPLESDVDADESATTTLAGGSPDAPGDAPEASTGAADPGDAEDPHDSGATAATSNGNGAHPDEEPAEGYDPDATAPEMSAYGSVEKEPSGALTKIESGTGSDRQSRTPADTDGGRTPEAAPEKEARKQPRLSAVPDAGAGISGDAADGAHMTRRLTTRLGQLLLDADLLSDAQLKKALEKQHETGERLGAILINEGYIKEADLLSVLANQHGVPTANLDAVKLDPALTQMIPADMARRYQLIPMATGRDSIDVAMVDPTDFVAMAHVRFATGLRPNVFITTATAAARAMARLYAGKSEAEPAELTGDPREEIKKMILDRDALLIGAEQDPRKFYELAASIDRFVDEIVRKASS